MKADNEANKWPFLIIEYFVTAKFLLNFDTQQEMGETWCQGGLKKVK
jgi:hypothetical protein